MTNREYRSIPMSFRINSEEDKPKRMFGHFSMTETPYEVRDYDGHYLETIARGAFVETLASNKDKIKIMLDHGQDPTVAKKPLGKLVVTGEDERGGFYEVELLDTSYVRDLIPALEHGLYGASFSFRVVEEDWDRTPKRSDANPEALPERRVTKVEVFEFGPVMFPANPNATSSVRSLTNKNELISMRTEDDKVEAVTIDVTACEVEETRDNNDTPISIKEGQSIMSKSMTVEERSARLDEIEARLTVLSEIDDLSEDESTEFETLRSEVSTHEEAITKINERKEYIVNMSKRNSVERSAPAVHVTPDNIYDESEVRNSSRSSEEYNAKMYDAARRVVDAADYSGSDNSARAKSDMFNALGQSRKDSTLARRFMNTASPVYREAYSKWVGGMAVGAMSTQEQRAMALGTDADGGFGVPHDLDPSIILTSDGAINPLRQIARVERITGKTLQLVTSAGITVNRAAFPGEGAPVVDGSPTLAREEFQAGRVSAYMPKSIEIEASYNGLDLQLTRALMEAKEEEEAATFVTAAGNGLTGIEGLNQLDTVGTVIDVAGTGVLTYADILGLDNALAPRHRRNATWLANNTTYNDIRLIDDNVGGDLWSGRMGARPGEIAGKPALEMSEMESQNDSTTNAFLIYGDFQKYIIVDRIGMVMKRVDVVVDLNGLPTGETALVAFWWNGGGFIDPNAFRGLIDNGV